MSRRAGLDTAAVVQAGAALADEEGLAELTFARLAERLGVRTPSLYNHVAGLDGLRRELALRGARDLGTRLARATIGRSGDDALVALGHAYRAFAKEHPGLYAAVQLAPAPGDAEWGAAGAEVVGIVVAALGGYGFAEEEALHVVRGLRSLMHGFAMLEIGNGFGLPLDLDESYRRLMRIYTAGLHATNQAAAPAERKW
jgi:AcrR family transcriptional regulator